jgi:tRNA dimethylallyltransferase
MMRFLEVYYRHENRVLPFLSKDKNRNFTPIIIGLTERPIIYDRINQQVDLMIREGLIEEAEKIVPNKN